MSSDEQILICAVRYALGRRSYIVGVVYEHIHYKRNKLSQECRRCIIRDIQEELERYHNFGQTLGDEIDEKTWERMLKELVEVEK